MDLTSVMNAFRGRRPLAVLACAMALPWAASASARGQGAETIVAQTVPGAAVTSLDSAALVQCQTAPEQAERSATFSGEMTAIPGATRMSMRIEVLERAPGEESFHTVIAPGLGVWRTADPGVKTYKHLQQVTNLAAPAGYRALVSFRWQGPHGRTLRRDERRTHRCDQPAPEPPPPSPPLE